MTRRHRSTFVRLPRWLAALATSLPFLVNAQTASGHDMGSMPGMRMDTPAPDQPKGSTPGKRPALPTKAKATPKAAAAASAPASGAKPAMDGGAMPGMDHSQMHHDAKPPVDHGAMPGMSPGTMPEMDHGSMPGMTHGAMPATAAPADARPKDMPAKSPAPAMSMDMDAMMKSMQGGRAPADARDPDAYADGLDHGHMPGMDMADDAAHVRVLLDRVEQFHGKDGNGQAVDAQAWAGGDLNKFWLKLDGERAGGRLGATRTEALWDHAIATYWSLQAGARHDFGDGPGRTWAAFGFQGLSPYWFDIQGTGYLGENGRSALRLEAEYDLRVTQRLILQPDVKVNLYGKNDRERGVGAGLSDIDAGLRLRYEISRKFAPYLGVVWNRRFATTARYAREAGGDAQETRVVAGVRIWF